MCLMSLLHYLRRLLEDVHFERALLESYYSWDC